VCRPSGRCRFGGSRSVAPRGAVHHLRRGHPPVEEIHADECQPRASIRNTLPARRSSASAFRSRLPLWRDLLATGIPSGGDLRPLSAHPHLQAALHGSPRQGLGVAKVEAPPIRLARAGRGEAWRRALSSFTGTLLVYPATGRAYSLATSYALSQGVAEAKLLPQFRSPLHGAYLFPLDGKSAADTLRRKLSPLRLPQGDLTQSVPRASGLIVLECDEGVVHRAASFESAREAAFPTLPPRGAAASSRPLLWEVLDAMGRTTHWPDPDAFSSLLASVSATKGEPLGERLRALEGSEDNVNVESLTGDSLVLSRPQLRAMFAIYS